jgi:hypothetical protein
MFGHLNLFFNCWIIFAHFFMCELLEGHISLCWLPSSLLPMGLSCQWLLRKQFTLHTPERGSPLAVCVESLSLSYLSCADLFGLGLLTKQYVFISPWFGGWEAQIRIISQLSGLFTLQMPPFSPGVQEVLGRQLKWLHLVILAHSHH